MARKNETEFLLETLRGNEEAVRLCQLFFRVSQVIDDLIDRDKPVSPEAITGSYWMALVEIPSNGFYLRHFNSLQPIVRQVFIDWMDSSALERQDDHGRNLAFVLRDSPAALVTQCAYLIGGYEWMRKVSTEIRKHIHEDTLDGYKAELDVEVQE